MNLFDLVVAKKLAGGGGGGGGPQLLATKSLGHIETSSSSETSLETSEFSGIDDWDADVLFVIASTDARLETNCHVSTVSVILRYNNNRALLSGVMNTVYIPSNDSYTFKPNTSRSGVYPKAAVISNGVLSLSMYISYSSTYTNTMNGDYTLSVYGMNIADLLK